jgi:hypothetical protein
MAANLFKLRYVPNPDGSESGTTLTDSNTVFVHTYLGDNATGDGSRANPYRSVQYAVTAKSGATYIVFRGIINEAFSTSKVIIGDDINQMLLFSNYSVSINSIINMTTDWSLIPSHYYSNYRIISGSQITSVPHDALGNYSFSLNKNLLSFSTGLSNYYSVSLNYLTTPIGSFDIFTGASRLIFANSILFKCVCADNNM